MSSGRVAQRMAVLLVLTILLSGCSHLVLVDYEANTHFRSFATYALVPDLDDEGVQSLDGVRIERALKDALGRQGLSRVKDPQAADIQIRYRIDQEVRLQGTGFTYGLGMNRDHFGVGLVTVPDIREFREGKLVVELVDNEEQQVVWRAVGQRTLTESMGAERRETLIRQLVEDMFRDYPPGH